MEEMIVPNNEQTKQGTEIQKNPIKRKRKKAPETMIEAVGNILKNELPKEEEISPERQIVNKRIVEWNKRKEQEKKKIRVRFRDYVTPNIIRTIQWQAYKDWPVQMWKVRDGDIITMDLATIRGLTAAGKKRILEAFNDDGFTRVRPNELAQTKYVERTIQLYGFESLEFDADLAVLPTPEILRPRSEVVFMQ